MAMAMSLIQVMAGLVVVVCMPGGTGQQPAPRDGHTMPASARPAPVPMPNAWHAGAGMLGTLPTGPAPATHHGVPLPAAPYASANLGGGLAGVNQLPPPNLFGPASREFGFSAGLESATTAGSGSGSGASRRHAIDKYSSRIRAIGDASTSHWMDWLEHADNVHCNRHHLKTLSRDVVASYLFVAFGLRLSDQLPARDKNGPQGVLSILRNEYVRKGTPISSGNMDANMIHAVAQSALYAVPAPLPAPPGVPQVGAQTPATAGAGLPVSHPVRPSEVMVSAPPAAGAHSAGAASSSNDAGLATPAQISLDDYACTFQNGAWIAVCMSAGLSCRLPPVLPTSAGFYTVTAAGFSQGNDLPPVAFETCFPELGPHDPDLCLNCNHVLKRRRAEELSRSRSSEQLGFD